VKGFFTNLVIYEDQDNSDLASYAVQAQESISTDIAGYKSIQEDFLTTPAGLPYLRWEIQGEAEDGTLIRIVVYIFDAGTHKEILQYTRPLNTGKEVDELVEEAINTVRFEE
jgi:hypothetical protein